MRQKRPGVQVSGGAHQGDGAPEARPKARLWGTHTTLSPGGPQVGAQSIMRRKEEPADPTTSWRSPQFVGVNGG